MRRIISKKNKEKRKQLILGLVLIFVMFGSVFGIVVNSFGKQDSTKKITYNGYEFIMQNDFWFTNNENFNFVFKYNPNQINRVNSWLNDINNYYSKPLYVFSDNQEAELEIYRNLNQIVQRIQPACFKEECEENWPVKTCEDNFIIIKEDEVEGISQNENCVFILGEQENLIKLTDGFLFKILGIEQ